MPTRQWPKSSQITRKHRKWHHQPMLDIDAEAVADNGRHDCTIATKNKPLVFHHRLRLRHNVSAIFIILNEQLRCKSECIQNSQSYAMMACDLLGRLTGENCDAYVLCKHAGLRDNRLQSQHRKYQQTRRKHMSPWMLHMLAALSSTHAQIAALQNSKEPKAFSNPET